MNPVKIGIIGCGNILPAYLKGCANYPILDLVGCADLDVDRANATAAEHGLSFGGSVDELLARPDVEVVVNLTIPAAHAKVNLQILEAGKHAYCEKPFAMDVAESRPVRKLAEEKGLRVGGAPDTFLGAGVQTARAFIDAGKLGTPVATTGFMLCPGHESWHPNPEFYYRRGGGPMFDMGPYYLTALVNLLGPVARVGGMARKTFTERTITSEPLSGTRIPVDVLTHYGTTLEFASGPIGTLTMSFDVPKLDMPHLVIHGTKGNLVVGDPNHFDSPCLFAPHGTREPEEIPMTHATGRLRGSGAADFAAAIRTARPHRASAELANHVLDIMASAEAAATGGQIEALESSCERPVALPAELAAGEMD